MLLLLTATKTFYRLQATLSRRRESWRLTIHNPPDIPAETHDEELGIADSDADLLRAVTGEPTTYDLLKRIIELLEQITAKQDAALGAGSGPVSTPPHNPSPGPYLPQPSRYPVNNPPFSSPPIPHPDIGGIWQAIDFQAAANHLGAYYTTEPAGDSSGLEEPDNGCPI